ncbi:MAG: hypothetical protein PUB52_05885 [Lachnospiraceae bacterium]|nr:hypothetical protein [Lachnospiraceae bacterium]MDD6504946.1 hypothetical protein [Lachnospiraceae bacterium]
MSCESDFLAALKGKKVPILVLDQKWHRLFAIHGKPEEIKELEALLNSLLARQGKLNNELKEMKKIKAKLMSNIVENMDDNDHEAAESREKQLSDDRRLIDEINEKSEQYEEELMELPEKIRSVNEQLMLKSMDYFYEKIRINKEESKEIEEWIQQVRIDLKKNIIRKQNRDINNKEMYAYLHDILGPEVLNLFDYQYEDGQRQEDTQS